MSNGDMFQKLIDKRSNPQSSGQQNITGVSKRRGRPANGKRSDPNWIGRTYYIQSATDLDVEEELLKLRREGADLDKSELVNALLCAWIKWRNGGNSEILLGEISPIQK